MPTLIVNYSYQKINEPPFLGIDNVIDTKGSL